MILHIEIKKEGKAGKIKNAYKYGIWSKEIYQTLLSNLYDYASRHNNVIRNIY